MTVQLDQRHMGVRAILRFVGPLVAVVGALSTLAGLTDFFSSHSELGRWPTHFLDVCLGGVLLILGLHMIRYAFLGAATRYVGDEVAPVGKDVMNYVAAGTKDSVRNLAAAAMLSCPTCHEKNDGSAKFCDHCGQPLAHSKSCVACGKANVADAHFCENCGRGIA